MGAPNLQELMLNRPLMPQLPSRSIVPGGQKQALSGFVAGVSNALIGGPKR